MTLLQEILSVFLITLSVGQFLTTRWQLRGASLVGPGYWAGYGLSLGLFIAGMMLLSYRPVAIWWVLLTSPITILLLMIGGNLILPPPSPDELFKADHPAHGGCYPVQIPDGDHFVPGYLLKPPAEADKGAAVCLLHGWGDSKNAFKWRLIQTLLNEGLTVLTIDLPGHGEYRHRLLSYPEALSTIPAALQFLRTQPGIQRVGLIGMSLGGAIAISSLAQEAGTPSNLVDLLVVIGTPVKVKYSHVLYYKELLSTCLGAPVLSLLHETNLAHLWRGWTNMEHNCRHTVDELFNKLNSLENIKKLKNLPILLVYGQLDVVAPPAHAQALYQSAPNATLITSNRASHVMLTLLPQLNRQVARWIKKQLSSS